MSKYCCQCRAENPDYALWCINCNAKLVEKLQIQHESDVKPNQNHRFPPKGDYISYKPPKKRFLKTFAIISISVIIFIATISYLGWRVVSDFSGINCQINEDFWFEGNKLITYDGWTFTMTKLQDYTLDGIVLGLKTYSKNDFPYKPINIFSPIDLVIGIDDVKDNPDNYPFSISYSYRCYWATCSGSAEDCNYLKTHMGNNHIIPHNESVLNELNNISINCHVLINGSLVNLYGTRGNDYYTWNSDTRIGNYDCEIILVDEIIINNF